MTPTIEARAATLLQRLLAERGARAFEVASVLGVAAAEVDRLLAGAGPLDLARLERVLGALGVPPGEFFARLYGEPAAPPAAGEAAPAAAEPPPPARPVDEPVDRREVEALLVELRGMIDGMIRLLDAEAAMGPHLL
jgi:transcriptional regulator with XRE-family HTH domain